MNRLILFSALLALRFVEGAILRVPGQFATIQNALDSASEGDTVLVVAGMYHEALITPEISVFLAGDTTANGERPIVDPSPLVGSDSLACLRAFGNKQSVSSFEFWNRSGMFPRFQGASGGIVQACDTLRLVDCVLDSLYDGVVASVNGRVLELSGCDFRYSLNYCFRTTSGCVVYADNCSFNGVATGWALLTAYGASRIANCRFSDQGGTQGELLLLASDGWLLESCAFLGANQDLSGWEAFSLAGSGVVRGCTFADNVVGQSVVTIRPSGTGVRFLENTFDNCRSISGSPAQPGGCMLILADEENSPLTTILNCSATACTSAGEGTWIWANAPVEAWHNRVTNMSASGSPVAYFHSADHWLRDNWFEENGVVAATGEDATVDALWNYWGDSTGPYNQGRNSEGLGDTVLGFVDFDPWYTDTLFWNSASPEPHPQLPNEVRLSVYPNPFNATTTLELFVPKAQIVEVKMYDLLGREVRQLFKGPAIEAKRITVNGAELASGIYFARASDPIRRKSLAEVKMLLVR